MAESLEQFLSRLRDDKELPEAGEKAICQGVVLPILARLGWDRDNIREVAPRYAVGDGRVDYCLKVALRKTFVEVKRASESLDEGEHQRQLLEYAFEAGVEIAVLTNGLTWWFYLPLLAGNWEQRRFFAVDIRQQETGDASARLTEFLGRGAIEDGSAIERAKALHASREKDRLIEEAMPRAWRELLREPEELLVDLLADKVEALCGHRAPAERVTAFLKQVAHFPPALEAPAPCRPAREPRRGRGRPAAGAELGRGGLTSRDCRRAVLQALAASGGAGHVRDVMQRVERILRATLGDWERSRDAGGEIRWKHRVHWQRLKMRHDGLLRSGSARGVWELTQAGWRAARSERPA